MNTIIRAFPRAQIRGTFRTQLPCTCYHGLPRSQPKPSFAPRCLAPAFSTQTQTPRFDKNPDPANPEHKERNYSDSEDPGYPPFSLDALGVRRNVKIVIYILLAIFGTMETWFYCKAILQWWRARKRSGSRSGIESVD